MLEIEKEALNGVRLFRPFTHNDRRGTLIKTFHSESLHSMGVDFRVNEEYYSSSAKHVLRGMHFQLPPYENAKLVYCITGSVLDVVVDLRRGSPTYRHHVSFELDSVNSRLVYIPAGMAHGILSLEQGSTIVCKSDCVYAPKYDAGILWNSFGFDWPCAEPLLSERDQELVPLDQFDSPFQYVADESAGRNEQA